MTPDGYAATARAVAGSILRAPPFVEPHRSPGLVQRILQDVGHGVAATARWVLDQLRRLFFHPASHALHTSLGGGSNVVLIALGALVVTLVAVLWVRRSRRAATSPEATPEHRERARRVAALLDRAAAARAAGDLDAALRLRFEAGLERLEDRGVVEGRSTLTTGAIARRLSSRTFDELSSVHTLVAYAGVPATGDDVAAAFERWPEVAETARAEAAGPS